jgi:hypothetical protein
MAGQYLERIKNGVSWFAFSRFLPASTDARRLVRLVSLPEGLASKSKSRQTAQAVADAASSWFNLALATNAAQSLDGWLRDTLASGSASIYDKAMDSAFIAYLNGDAPKEVQEALSGIEPYFHRLFDGVSNSAVQGGHDLASAWQAVTSASGSDSLLQEIAGYGSAVFNDLVTPMGLPLANLDRAQFDKIAEIAQEQIGVSKLWLADAVSFTATEMMGAAVGSLAIALKWSDEDLDGFAALAGVTGVAAIFSANPFLGVVAVVGLARSYQRALLERRYGDVAHGIMKGGFSGGAFIAGAAAFSGPVWGNLLVGLVCAMIVKRAYETGRAKMDVRWPELRAFIKAMMRRGKREGLLKLPPPIPMAP